MPHPALRLRTLLLSLSLASSAALAQSPSELAGGDEFQVNTYTSQNQAAPAVALYDGGYIVVWESEGSGGSDTEEASIQGQRFDDSGLAVGGEFQVNTTTTGSQQSPTVAAWPDGRFVVLWTSGALDLKGQLYDASGGAVGEEMAIDVTPPAISFTAATFDTGFLVASTEFDPQGSSFDLLGRRFDVDGTSVGSEFAMSDTDNIDGRATLDATPDGSILAVWNSTEQGVVGSGESSVQMRRFDVDGTPLSSAVQVNSYTTGTVGRVATSVAPDGSFMVAWTNEGSPGDDSEPNAVLARRFAADDSPLGEDFQVNSYTSGSQNLYDVQHLPAGGFLVAWGGDVDPTLDADGIGIMASRFAAGGGAVDGPVEDFVISQTTAGAQAEAALAADGAGNLFALWSADSSTGTDSSLRSIQGRRFVAEADIAVSLTNQGDSTTPGGLAAYDLDVTNGGPDAATGVRLELRPPEPLDCIWIADSDPGAGGFSASGEGAIVETLTVPAGGSVVYFLACLVDPAATGLLESTASITALDQTGNDTGDDTATDIDTLTPMTDLSITAAA
ncbi:MAG: hypothetical protein AAFY88_19605, partial [Acidobacteriota bacterium]